ncbi:MAG: tRNA lysidine(34) synthetase TilS, partial [Lysobacterales bacterium]
MSTPLNTERLCAALPRLAAGGHYVLAYSGGLDSTVLLHLLHIARLPVKAVHVHHGLRPEADRWAEHCRAQCADLNIPFELRRVNITGQSELGLEAAARAARYAALAQSLGPQDVLLTAQHQDDQAETVLLQLLRGAGPHGLAGMPALASFGAVRFARPLLGYTRAELEAYAKCHGLRWVEDPSNHDPAIKRSHLRQHLLPEIERQWPGSAGALARSARLQAEAAELLGDLAQADATLCTIAGSKALSVAALNMFKPVRQRNLLRHWLAKQQLPLPAAVHLDQVLSEVLLARADANPCLRWPGAELRRYRDSLYAMPPLPPAPTASIPWDLRVLLM